MTERYTSIICAVFVVTVTLVSNCQTAFSNPWTWVPLYKLSAKQDVSVDPDRYFHGPALTVAPNGDWLLSHQDSANHVGHDSVIRQVRSTDQGKTWTLDGTVYDGRQQDRLGRNPTYGVTADGLVILVVQVCQSALSHGPWQDRGGYYGDNIEGSVWLTSKDNGKTYQERGWVNQVSRIRHTGTTGHILEHDGRLFMAGLELGSWSG